MKKGISFEVFVKQILINVGFSEVVSDDIYIFEGASGQMVQGLGEVHNADVLLEPPAQTPFISQVRLLIECKDYHDKIGLDTVRSVLGLREDINHFEVLDKEKILSRKSQRRKEFLKNKLKQIEENSQGSNETIKYKIRELADEIGKRLAIAITNSGQMIFLYSDNSEPIFFDEYYDLYWSTEEKIWKLKSGNRDYIFQLPEYIFKQWLENVDSDLKLKEEALRTKETFFSRMIVYYRENNKPQIKMISIDRENLINAKKVLEISK